MPFVRVFATMIDDGEHNEDTRSKLVLHLKIDPEGKPDPRMEGFGYNECWSEGETRYKKYPFIIQWDDMHKVPCHLSYAGWDEESEDRVNLHQKEIREGVSFTFFEFSGGEALESIYRIMSVHEI